MIGARGAQRFTSDLQWNPVESCAQRRSRAETGTPESSLMPQPTCNGMLKLGWPTMAHTYADCARVPLESLGLDMCMHAYVQSSTSHFHLLLFNLLYVFGDPFQLSRLCTPISIENVELSI